MHTSVHLIRCRASIFLCIAMTQMICGSIAIISTMRRCEAISDIWNSKACRYFCCYPSNSPSYIKQHKSNVCNTPYFTHVSYNITLRRIRASCSSKLSTYTGDSKGRVTALRMVSTMDRCIYALHPRVHGSIIRGNMIGSWKQDFVYKIVKHRTTALAFKTSMDALPVSRRPDNYAATTQIDEVQTAVMQSYRNRIWKEMLRVLPCKGDATHHSTTALNETELECIDDTLHDMKQRNKTKVSLNIQSNLRDELTTRNKRLINAIFSLPDMKKYEELLNRWNVTLDELRIDTNSGLLRVNRSRVLNTIPYSDWKLVFLGTGSMYSSGSRSTSAFVFQRNTNTYDSWLFDCGEGIQLSASMLGVRPGKFTHIFITHLHGDHCLGLLSILALRSTAEEESDVNRVIDVYGPEGLRDFLRNTMQLTFVKRGCKLRIHELKNVPMLTSLKRQKTHLPVCEAPVTKRLPKELLDEEQDLYPDSQWRYTVLEKEDTRVTAIPIRHTIPTVGYIIEEVGVKGQLNEEVLDPIVKRNLQELKQWPSLNEKPLSVYEKYLRNMTADDAFTFPDGTMVTYNQVMKNVPLPRKIVFCQDTCDATLMIPHAQNADVLIHEATNSNVAATSNSDEFLLQKGGCTHSGDSDSQKTKNKSKSKRKDMVATVAFNRGHSTPPMAGKFAALINAKQLVLTHFSQRYKGDSSLKSVLTMRKIEQEALNSFTLDLKKKHRGEVSKLCSNRSVVAAWDGMVLPVPRQSAHKI